jgi:hypothetical protein
MAITVLATTPMFGQGDDGAEPAKKRSNPIADLVRVPFQVNWDSGVGPAPGEGPATAA